MIRLSEHASVSINLDYQGYNVLIFYARDCSGGNQISECYYSV